MEVEERILNDTILELEAQVSVKPSFLFFLEEIFILLIVLFSIVLNLTVVFLILKFKKMRTRLNILICNVCINNVFLSVVNPGIIALTDIILNVNLNMLTICYSFDLVSIFMIASEVFMFLISLNSMFKLSTKWFRLIIFGVWAVVIMAAISNTLLCAFRSYFHFSGMDFWIFMFISAIILIRVLISLKDVLQKKVTKEERFRQELCALYVFPVLVVNITFICSVNFWPGLWIKIMLQVYFCLPIFEVVFLIMRDGNYKMCFANLMNCKYNYIEAAITYKTGSDDENHLSNEDLETSDDLETSA